MPFLAPILSSAVGSFLVRLAITYVIGRIQQNAMEKKMKAMQKQAAAVMVNTASNSEPLNLIYGRTRVGGNRTYTETTDGAGDTKGTQYLNMVLAMGEGRLGDIRQLWFDDKCVWDIAAGGTTESAGNGTRLKTFRNDGLPAEETLTPYAGALNDADVYIIYHDGSDSQASDTVLSSSVGSGTWTSNHRLRGIAYLMLKLKANAGAYKGGLPLVTAVVDGKNIQNVSTVSQGATSIVYNTVGNDQNPVDVLYDLLVSKRYGKGLDHDTNGNYSAGLHIDLDSFKAARTKVNGYFKINGVLATGTAIYNNVGEILESMNGILVFQNGRYKLRIKQQNETSVHTFTSENILSSVSVQLPAKESKYNKMTAQYRNRDGDHNYNEDIVISDNSVYRGEDNGVTLEGQIRLDLVDETSLVQAISDFQMNESRYQMVVKFDAAHTALKVECGDIITVIDSNFGWDSGKLFRVAQMELTQENTISITAIEYNSSIQLV